LLQQVHSRLTDGLSIFQFRFVIFFLGNNY
jgi:hypothetical protein